MALNTKKKLVKKSNVISGNDGKSRTYLATYKTNCGKRIRVVLVAESITSAAEDAGVYLTSEQEENYRLSSIHEKDTLNVVDAQDHNPDGF